MERVGKHILIDVYDVQDVDRLKSSYTLYDLMNMIVDRLNLNTLDFATYDFQPFGTTIIYLLSESHMSIHTFPEKYSFNFDLFCCNKNVDLNQVCDIIYEYFETRCKIFKKIVDR